MAIGSGRAVGHTDTGAGYDLLEESMVKMARRYSVLVGQWRQACHVLADGDVSSPLYCKGYVEEAPVNVSVEFEAAVCIEGTEYCSLKLCFRRRKDSTLRLFCSCRSMPEAKDAFVAPLTSRPLWPWPPSHLLFESMRLFLTGFKLQLAQAFFGWTTRQWCLGHKSDRYWQIWLKLMFQVWPSELRLAVKERAALELVEGSLVISLGSQWHTARYGHWNISFAPHWMFHDVSIGCPKSLISFYVTTLNILTLRLWTPRGYTSFTGVGGIFAPEHLLVSQGRVVNPEASGNGMEPNGEEEIRCRILVGSIWVTKMLNALWDLKPVVDNFERKIYIYIYI